MQNKAVEITRDNAKDILSGMDDKSLDSVMTSAAASVSTYDMAAAYVRLHADNQPWYSRWIYKFASKKTSAGLESISKGVFDSVLKPALKVRETRMKQDVGPDKVHVH